MIFAARNVAICIFYTKQLLKYIVFVNAHGLLYVVHTFALYISFFDVVHGNLMNIANFLNLEPQPSYSGASTDVTALKMPPTLSKVM